MPQPLIPVADAAAVINSLADQYMGGTVVVNDDLSNIADLGRAYDDLDSATKQAVTSGMITLVTEQEFIAPEYKGNGLDIIRSRSAYTSDIGLIQRNRPALFDAVSDAEVYDPEPASSSDPFVNYPITFYTDYWRKTEAWRHQWSEPERWMSGMFLSQDKFFSAIAALRQQVQNSMALRIEATTMAILRGSIALNMSGVDLPTVGTNRAVNLLARFNAAYSQTLTAAKAMQDPEFLRFAVNQIFTTKDYLRSFSTLYNEKGVPNFVNDGDMHVVMLSMMRRGMDQFMLSDAYNKEFLELNGQTVNAWKGLLNASGGPDFSSVSAVNDTFEYEGEDFTVNTDGVLAHIYGTDRIGIHNLSVTNTSQFDPVGLKTNRWTHLHARSIVDPYVPAVTFYVKDAEAGD